MTPMLTSYFHGRRFQDGRIFALSSSITRGHHALVLLVRLLNSHAIPILLFLTGAVRVLLLVNSLLLLEHGQCVENPPMGAAENIPTARCFVVL